MSKEIFPSLDGGTLHVKFGSNNTVVETRDANGTLTGHVTSIHDGGIHNNQLHIHPNENDKSQDYWK